MTLLRGLTIQKMIFHEIIGPNDASEYATVNYHDNILIDLDQEIADEITSRITAVMGASTNKSLELELPNGRIDADSCPEAIRDLIANEADDNSFNRYSRRIADFLATAQGKDKRVLNGPLFILTGLTGAGADRKRYVCLIKADFQKGLIQEEEELVFLRKIFLTANQRLYKVAFILEKSNQIENRNEDSNFSYFVYDQNMNTAQSNRVASYFYSNFLGLKISNLSAIQTQDFFNTTKSYINNSGIDPVDKVELTTHLYSYILSPNRTVINFNTWARDSIGDDEFRNSYIEHCRARITSGNIRKDTTFINPQLKKRYLNFENGIKIPIDSVFFEENVEVEMSEDESSTTITVNSKLS